MYDPLTQIKIEYFKNKSKVIKSTNQSKESITWIKIRTQSKNKQTAYCAGKRE